jgi:hypothetical protein
MPRGVERDPVEARHDLGLLAAIGLGPQSLLLSEPKLFLEVGFLGALIAQLEQELGLEAAARVLFQIGLLHGMRDADRVLQAGFSQAPAHGAPSPTCTSTPLRIQIAPGHRGAPAAGRVIVGSWPDGHEARARLGRLGAHGHASCHLSAGYTSGWLSGTQDLDVLACESECSNQGARVCRFEARELAEWREPDVPAAIAPLLALPFASFRELACERPAAAARLAAGALDAAEPAVHVWGPVMVLPFTNADQALATAAMLGRESGTAGVRVVVVDLRGEVLDDGFDAAGLEQLLEVVEAWGADVVLTGVSPLSEEVVCGLEATHLLIRKNLPEAIASAFQIAEAQRHLL